MLETALKESDCTHFALVSESFAPDESYFATALSVPGRPPLQRVANRHFTWTHWASGGKHPEEFHEVSPDLVARISDSGCFFARKFAVGSNIGDFQLHLDQEVFLTG